MGEWITAGLKEPRVDKAGLEHAVSGVGTTGYCVASLGCMAYLSTLLSSPAEDPLEWRRFPTFAPLLSVLH